MTNPVHGDAVDVIVRELDRLDEAERQIRASAARVLDAVGDDAWSWPVLSYLETRFSARLVPGVVERRVNVEESPAFRRVVLAMSEVVRGGEGDAAVPGKQN